MTEIFILCELFIYLLVCVLLLGDCTFQHNRVLPPWLRFNSLFMALKKVIIGSVLVLVAKQISNSSI